MTDFPRSLLEFQHRFPDDAACAVFLAAARWPGGFVCPACGGLRACLLVTKADTYQCSACHKQTSVTAGTVMHGSKLSLTVWFWAAYLMATHSNGISARQLWRQLGLGSYKSAWLLAAKLRRAMVDPERHLLSGLIEVDETQISYRTKDDPPAGGGGRSGEGKLQVAAAVEIQGKGPGRVRLAMIKDASATSLRSFLNASVAPGATIKTDGWSGYPGAPGITHEPHVVGNMAACFPDRSTDFPAPWARHWPNRSQANGASCGSTPPGAVCPTDILWSPNFSQINLSDIRMPSTISVLALFMVTAQGAPGAIDRFTRWPAGKLPYMAIMRSMELSITVSAGIEMAADPPETGIRRSALKVIGPSPAAANAANAEG